MNYKALALGAVLGFMAALSPACGPVPEKCTTCTDANGDCIGAVSDQACGAGDAACINCAAQGQECDVATGTCKAPTGTDAGQDAGTTCAATCQGCCTATGTCLPGNQPSNCGSGGATCDTCAVGMGEKCEIASGETARTCFVPAPVDAGPQVGNTCATAADCAFLGAGAKCITAASEAQGGAPYPVGYCTVDCGPQGECPTNSACVELNETMLPDGGIRTLTGQDLSVCLGLCDPETNEPCGQNTFCLATQTGGVCAPYTAIPAGMLGSACTSGTQCSFPPVNGFCLPETGSAGPTGFNGGACMADCTFNRDCGDDGLCLGVSDTDDTSFCIEKCPGPGTRSTCRDGYTCIPLTSGGMPIADGVCFPACDSPNNACDMGACNATTGLCE